MTTYNDAWLAHHGVQGQKWGVRRYQNPDGTRTAAGIRHQRKLAKKDAKEFARAKMFYGKGAGNRRKLIKATVNERSKDADYKKAFDEYSAKQDMSKHAKAAKRERHARDVKDSASKTVRGAWRWTNGDRFRVTIAGAALATGAAFYLKNREAVNNVVSRTANTVINKLRR